MLTIRFVLALPCIVSQKVKWGQYTIPSKPLSLLIQAFPHALKSRNDLDISLSESTCFLLWYRQMQNLVSNKHSPLQLLFESPDPKHASSRALCIKMLKMTWRFEVPVGHVKDTHPYYEVWDQSLCPFLPSPPPKESGKLAFFENAYTNVSLLFKVSFKPQIFFFTLVCDCIYQLFIVYHWPTKKQKAWDPRFRG